MTDKKNAGFSPLWAGFLCKCPNCAKGRLFGRFLKVAPSCAACGFDFPESDAGDGPAVFIVLIVGFVVTFAALLVEVKYAPPYWLHAVLWLPLTLGLSIGLLQPFKGLLLAIQFHHGAAEARIEDNEPGPR
ncbi:MAG: DUF983 domain-containing protein [Proteobacteria bacterium]|nr:DUF983 domain-containing protein [Pseudomonadota bacterium]